MTINKLNDDVLAEIFKAATQSTRDHSLRVWVSITLSHVASRWRRVALNTPTLWTAFHIDLQLMLMVEAAYIIELFLARSGVLPLSISVSFPRPVSAEDRGQWGSMDQMISRCDRLDIVGRYQKPYTVHSTLGVLLRSPSPPAGLSRLCISRVVLLDNDLEKLCSLANSTRLEQLWLDYITFVPTPTSIYQLGLDLSTLCSFRVCQTAVQALQISMSPEWGGLEVVEFVDGDDYHITVPSLQALDIHTEFLARPVQGSNFQGVRQLVFSAFSPSRKYVAETICALRALEELTLDVSIGRHFEHPDEAVPSQLYPPPLVSIDFATSSDIDDIARFLVEGTTTDGLGAGSLKSVDMSESFLSPSLREWIAKRVSFVKDRIAWS